MSLPYSSLSLESIQIRLGSIYTREGVGAFILPFIAIFISLSNKSTKNFKRNYPIFVSIIFYFFWYLLKGDSNLTRHYIPIIVCSMILIVDFLPLIRVNHIKKIERNPKLMLLVLALFILPILKKEIIVEEGIFHIKYKNSQLENSFNKGIIREGSDD